VPSFTVTAAGQRVNLDSSGTAKASFTVTNTGAQALRGRLLTRPSDPAKPEWLSIVGEPVRDFAPNAAEQVVVQLDVPPNSTPGSYSFRLDAVSEADPDEDFTEGPSVAFDIAAPPPPAKKKFPWWILAVVGAVLLLIIIAVVVWLLVRGGGGNNDRATQLVGNWRNVDPNTRSTTHYVIAKSGDVLNISGYGACSPTDCDWAASVGGPRTVTLADANDGVFSIVWNFGFKTQVDDMALDGKRLKVLSTHTYTDNRAQRIETQFFEKAP
jgi:hypothetical protein